MFSKLKQMPFAILFSVLSGKAEEITQIFSLHTQEIISTVCLRLGYALKVRPRESLAILFNDFIRKRGKADIFLIHARNGFPTDVVSQDNDSE